MDYELLTRQALELAREDGWYVPLMANVSALIFEQMPDLNWAGFYIAREGGLTLGPFQGKAACIHIPCGRGVCGTAMALDATQRVEDVHAFPGHIACDGASNSCTAGAGWPRCWISTAHGRAGSRRRIRRGWRRW